MKVSADQATVRPDSFSNETMSRAPVAFVTIKWFFSRHEKGLINFDEARQPHPGCPGTGENYLYTCDQMVEGARGKPPGTRVTLLVQGKLKAPDSKSRTRLVARG